MIPTELLAHIERWEGFRSRPYLDNRWADVTRKSIGFGTLALRDAEVVSREEARWRAVSHLAQCEKDLAGAFSPTEIHLIGPVRRACCIAMIYQMGLGGFRRFAKMIAALKRGEWALASAEALNSTWARRQSPKRAEEIAAMLATGEWGGLFT